MKGLDFFKKTAGQNERKKKTVMLPSREEMLARLKAKFNDDSYIQEGFYPYLLKLAGRKLVASEIVMSLGIAIQDYNNETTTPPEMRAGKFYERESQLVDVLVDDKEVAEQAKAFLKEKEERINSLNERAQG